jgi:hypothetical protein
MKRLENSLYKEITFINKKDKTPNKNLTTTKNQLTNYYPYWWKKKPREIILLIKTKPTSLLKALRNLPNSWIFATEKDFGLKYKPH